MPITQSAKKPLGVKRKRIYNIRRKDAVSDILKKSRNLSRKRKLPSQAILPSAYQAIDKAAKIGYIKKTTRPERNPEYRRS